MLKQTFKYRLSSDGERIVPYEVEYDYRQKINVERNKPENKRKRQYLTMGNQQSELLDNLTEIQQLISVTDNDEVAGFFEYHISRIATEELRPVYTEVYDAETGTITQEPKLDPDGNPVMTQAFSDQWMGVIVEMMSYNPSHFLTFGIDLYNLLERCFTTPISEKVFRKLNPDALSTDPIPTLSRVEWYAFWDNPSLKEYDQLVKKMGGVIIVPEKRNQLKKYIITKKAFLTAAYRGDPNDINL
jgi:hypothetical protein